MDDERLLTALRPIVDLLTRQVASHRALERAVFALVSTHPQPQKVLEALEAHLELDAVDTLNSTLLPDTESTCEAQRLRLLRAIGEVVALRSPSSGD